MILLTAERKLVLYNCVHISVFLHVTVVHPTHRLKDFFLYGSSYKLGESCLHADFHVSYARLIQNLEAVT